MRILLTGACGFVGRPFVERLSAEKHQVFAAVQNPECGFSSAVEICGLDLRDEMQVKKVVRQVKPSLIFHLAAQSMVQKSWENPAETMQINTLGTIHLLQAAAMLPQVRFINIGSSDEYGRTALTGHPLTEESACQPANPYAVSKYASGQLALQLGLKSGFPVIHLRPFNHFGPGQQVGFAISDFCSQIAKIEKGEAPPVLQVGDLSAFRDFTDVRDVLEAYVAVVQTGIPAGVYNVCSGQARQLDQILRSLLSLSDARIEVQPDPARTRAAEIPYYVGSAEKLQRATGWQPSREFGQSLRETLDWWRGR